MFTTRLAASALLLGSLAVLPACHDPSYADERPDPSALVRGDKGIQSADVIAVSDWLAPQVLQIPEISQNPARITVVVLDMKNGTRTLAGQNLNVFNRLAGNLATHATMHIAFVARQADTLALQQQEGGGNPDIFEQGSRNGVPPQTRVVPQYALQGTLLDMPNNSTTYYYCEFKLTNIATGVQVWTGQYDLKVRN